MRTTKRFNRNYTRTTHFSRPTGRPNPGWNPGRYPTTSAGFRQPRTECEWRMSSYRAIYWQFTGPGKQTAFSPTNANKWLRFINQGQRIYRFTNTEFSRHFGNQWNNFPPTACLKWLRQKYGTGIKAVTRGRANTWLVAATPNVAGRPFQQYNWNWK